ncbi:signal transduction histidine kinase [Saccharothrix algeriensis]|uniref:histidine kinase n=1 Tax=Saccharothrix algeriensis TaxID=173560 RepID=A0ABS2SEJ9_9PSEU|nr:signal transduction histidine kinase [Saccharothrix algeriensis]
MSLAWQRVRLAVIAGMAAWVVFLNVVPPKMTPGATVPATWLLTAVTVLPVLLCLTRPLWAWRVAAVLIAGMPLVHEGLADLWGWPWTAGLFLSTATVLYVVAENHCQAVLVWVFLFTVACAWAHLEDWRDLFLLGAITAGLLLLGSTRRLRRIAEADREEQQRRRVVEEVRAATLEERALIARELHDVVAHHMSVLALRADSARYRFPHLSEELREEFAAMQDTARAGMTEMRRLLGVLRNADGRAETAPQPGVGQIAELVERLRHAGVAVSLHVDVGAVPDGVALSAYRIVQEALSNAVRHAAGAEVDVRLDADAESLRLIVANTAGTGAAPGVKTERARHGLLGMRERVAALGGAFRAGTSERGGFTVEVTLPLDGVGG